MMTTARAVFGDNSRSQMGGLVPDNLVDQLHTWRGEVNLTEPPLEPVNTSHMVASIIISINQVIRSHRGETMAGQTYNNNSSVLNRNVNLASSNPEPDRDIGVM